VSPDSPSVEARQVAQVFAAADSSTGARGPPLQARIFRSAIAGDAARHRSVRRERLALEGEPGRPVRGLMTRLLGVVDARSGRIRARLQRAKCARQDFAAARA